MQIGLLENAASHGLILGKPGSNMQVIGPDRIHESSVLLGNHTPHRYKDIGIYPPEFQCGRGVEPRLDLPV